MANFKRSRIEEQKAGNGIGPMWDSQSCQKNPSKLKRSPKTPYSLLFMLLYLCALGCSSTEDKSKTPVAFSLAKKIAWPASKTHDVTGLHLGIGGGSHEITGLDLSLFPVSEELVGVQCGALCAINSKKLSGLQFAPFLALSGPLLFGDREDPGIDGLQISAWASLVSGPANGVQFGLLSMADELNGLQIGIATSITDRKPIALKSEATEKGESAGLQLAAFQNESKGELRGAQISLLYNKAESLKGFQFGLINVNPDGWLPICPILNVAW